MNDPKREKNIMIVFCSFCIIVLYLFVGGYGLIFINQLKMFGKSYGIKNSFYSWLLLFKFVVVAFLVLNLFYALVSLFILRNKKWAFKIIETSFWFPLVLMILIMGGNLFFIFGIDFIFNIKSKGLAAHRLSGFFMFIIYLVIIMIVVFVKKQLIFQMKDENP